MRVCAEPLQEFEWPDKMPIEDMHAQLKQLLDQRDQLKDLPSEKRRPPFFDDPSFRRKMERCLDRHAISGDVSPIDHLARRRNSIRDQITFRKLLYLDTNHWIRIRDVVLNRQAQHPRYDEIFKLLTSLRRRKRICCPVSAAIVTELMKQTDIKTRSATAQIMEKLSGGVCMRDWISVSMSEMAAMAIKQFGDSSSPFAHVQPWTRVADCLGLIESQLKSSVDPSMWPAIKAAIDMYWGLSVEEYTTIPNWIEATAYFGEAIAQESNSHATVARESSETFDAIVENYRISLIQGLKDDLVRTLKSIRKYLRGTPSEHIETLFEEARRTRDPRVLPTWSVLSFIYGGVVVTGRRFRPHDALDFEHACQAIPYCEALFCDRPMKNLLNEPRLRLGSTYDCTILSDPDEIVEFLRNRSL